MNEYDRWYRNYRRHQAIIENGSALLIGAVLGAVGIAFIWLILIVFG